MTKQFYSRDIDYINNVIVVSAIEYKFWRKIFLNFII